MKIADEKERRLFTSFIRQKFGGNIARHFLQECHLLLTKRKLHLRFFLIDKKNPIFMLPKNIFSEAFSAGVPFLDYLNGSYALLPSSIPILNSKVNSRIYLDEKKSLLFLYGRDIFKNSILKIKGEIKKGNYCMVLDHNETPIGIGEFLISKTHYHTAPKTTIVVRNIIDIGYYLRCEK